MRKEKKEKRKGGGRNGGGRRGEEEQQETPAGAESVTADSRTAKARRETRRAVSGTGNTARRDQPTPEAGKPRRRSPRVNARLHPVSCIEPPPGLSARRRPGEGFTSAPDSGKRIKTVVACLYRVSPKFPSINPIHLNASGCFTETNLDT